MKEEKEKEQMESNKKGASSSAVGNVASTDLEVHPDTAPPLGKGDDAKEKRIIEDLFDSSSSSSSPFKENGMTVIAKEKVDLHNNTEKNKDLFATVKEHSVIQSPPPPQPTQNDILKVEKDLKKQQFLLRDSKPQIQPTTQPPPRPLPLTSPQQEQPVKNDSSPLELQPVTQPDLSLPQQTDDNNMNRLVGKHITVSHLEEQPVMEHTLSAQDQRDRDKANYSNNNNNSEGVGTQDDLEQGTVANPINNNVSNRQQPPHDQPAQNQQQGPQEPFLLVGDAVPVLTAQQIEEQRRQQLEQERQNLPLIEGQAVTSRRPSLTPSQQEAKQKKKENSRLVILFFVCAFILVIVLVPSLLLTNRNNNNNTNAINSNLATISPSPSSNSSTSLIPSFIPSILIVPSSFPTTSSPTSTAFDNIVALLGLEEKDSLSLSPNDYVFQSIRWMAEQDQVTRDVLLRLQISGTEQQTQGGQEAVIVQRFAVICLYYATEGDSWFDRLELLNPFTHECEWRVFGREQILDGATINCVDNVIEGIALNDNNLGGMIPSEIGLLTQLTHLELQRNEIGGTLPSSLSRLSRLEILILERNKISGSIPSELTTLNNLVVVWLLWNDLTGSIPESIGDLTNLIVLGLCTTLE